MAAADRSDESTSRGTTHSMVIQRYIAREVLVTFVGVALVLSLIFVSGAFIAILADAAAGEYPTHIILRLFGLTTIGNLVLILPLALFLAVMLAMGRLAHDGELTALYACGMGPTTLFMGVSGVASLVAVVVVLLTLWVAPWAEEERQRLIDSTMAQTTISGVTPGTFHPLGQGRLLYMAEEGGQQRTVFSYGQDDVISARGIQEVTQLGSAQRVIQLQHGYRYQGAPGQAGFRITQFEQYELPLKDREVVAGSRRDNALPSAQLWGADKLDLVGELQWRISMGLGVLVLAVLAIPLSGNRPREGRYGRLFISILFYLIYSNLLVSARAALEHGEVPPWVGLWWVHLLFLAIAGVMLWRQVGFRRVQAGGGQ